MACLSALVLSPLSCASFEPEVRHELNDFVPDTFTLYTDQEPGPDHWWTAFNVPELDALVTTALADNLDIAQAAARIRQANAIAQQVGSARRPSLGYSVDASLSRRRTELGGGESGVDASTRRLNALNSLLGSAAGGITSLQSGAQAAERAGNAIESLTAKSPATSITQNVDSYGVGLTAGYEVDLWGRLRAGETAAWLDLEASQAEVNALRLSVAGQVVLTWLDLVEVSEVLNVVQGQLEANETNLSLIDLRYRNGIATTLDVYQQRQAVAEVKTVIPPLEARFQVLQHTLSVLLGKGPRSPLELGELAFAPSLPLPEIGLPIDLIARRPDVRAAGLRLHASDWDVAAAQADRLPRLQLTAGLSSDMVSLGAIFDNWIAQLAASVTGPIFDGGRRQAEIARTRAVVDERLGAYKLTVLNAVKEVDDALILMDRQQAYIDALALQLAAAENAHHEALGRYRKGLTDYLPVLTALRNRQGLERDVVEATHDRLVYRVQLHLVLGGGWAAEDIEVVEGIQE